MTSALAPGNGPDSGSDEEVKLGWKDYLAFIIAAFETILVPLLVFVLVLLVVLFVILR